LITLTNDFHRSTCTVRVPSLPATLSESQTRRVRRELCTGGVDCKCGAVRGRQYTEDGERLEVEWDYETWDEPGGPYLRLAVREQPVVTSGARWPHW